MIRTLIQKKDGGLAPINRTIVIEVDTNINFSADICIGKELPSGSNCFSPLYFKTGLVTENTNFEYGAY